MAQLRDQIYVRGLREFQGELRRLGGEFPRELGKTNKKAAGVVVREAIPRVRVLSTRPGSTSAAPGALKATVRALGSVRRAQVAMGGARFQHPAVQEFGWKAHGITPMNAIYGSIAATRDEVIETYGEMVDDLARRAFPH